MDYVWIYSYLAIVNKTRKLLFNNNLRFEHDYVDGNVLQDIEVFHSE